MGKRIFWIFILTVVAVTAAALMYIQSEHFARIAKEKIQTAVARDLNLDLSFDRLQVGVLPPSLSMLNVDLKVLAEKNALGLSQKTVFRAGRLGFSFRMIQAFSRGISVNKVFLADGEVDLPIPKSKSTKKQKLSELVHEPIEFALGDGMNISIRQLEVRNTRLRLTWQEDGAPAEVKVQNVSYLAVTPSAVGTNLVANLEESEISLPKIHERIRAFKVNADIQRDLITLTNFDALRKEAAVHAAGKLVGSIDHLENSKADIDLIVRSPFSELADLEKSLANFSGGILADVKVVGKVADPSVQGKLEINDFKHSLWEIENIKVEGSYGSGFLTLDSLSAAKAGGKVSLKNKFEASIPFQPENRTLQLQFSGVRFEEFAGDLKKDVNNLKMGLDGSATVRVEFANVGGKAKLAGIQLKPELSVKELELTNQVYGKARPYKTIFMTQPFQLGGNIQWKPGEVRVIEGRLAFPSGTIETRGTVTDERGFDLRGVATSIDLGKEVGQISGLKITGVGPAEIYVHGKNDAVLIDFDVNQREARFDDYDFGELAGRVTYDDKNSYILLSNLKGKKGESKYEVPNGKVNIGDGDDLEINATFPDSNPNDIFAIFAKQLAPISWIPHGMGGEVEGTARVGGGYDKGLESLTIDARLKGKNLSYKGEMVHELTAQAGLSNGTLSARILHSRKYDTAVAGQIDYKLKTEEMKYSLSSTRGKLRSLDFVTSTGIPIDGLFTFHSEGQGRWETLQSSSHFEVQNAFVRTQPLPPFTLVYKTFPDRSEYQARLGEGVELSGRLGYTLRDDSFAHLQVNNAALDFLLCALNRRNCSDPALALSMSGSGKLGWKGNSWSSMSGSAAFQDLTVAKTGFQLKSNNTANLRVTNGRVELERITFQGEQSKLNVSGEGRVDGTNLGLRLQGDVSLKILEFFTSLVEETRGRLNVNLGLSGQTNDAKFTGGIDIQEGYLRLNGIDAPIDGLGGRIQFQNSRMSVESLSGNLGGGTVQASGAVDLFLDRSPRFDLDFYFANNRVKFYPVSFAEIGDAKLSLTGERPPYLFGGTARIRRIMVRNNFDVTSRKSLQNARYLPEKQSGAKSLYEIRIRAIAENGVFVENNLLNAEFKGEVTLLNNFEFPQVVAKAELVRGKFLFRNTAFTLDHAYIRAPTPEFFNPQFSIGGVANVDNYRISLFANGTIERPKISLNSYPALPQEDIVSLLAFGYRGEDARKVNPNNTNAITYSEVGSILLEQLQLNQNLQSKGMRVMVQPSLNETEASIIRPDSSQTAAPKVILQTQIMKNLDAVFGGTVGSTQGQSVDAKLEYRLGRKASVSAVYEQTPAGLDATETKNSYGADLKFRWGFK